MQSEYARLAGMTPAALTAAMAPYLPIIHVRFLLGPAASPALRERLLQHVEALRRFSKVSNTTAFEIVW